MLDDYFTIARKHMVDSQVAVSNISDARLLDVFAAIPREEFVLQHQRDLAYMDNRLPLSNGRYLLDPMTQARLLDTARIQSTDTVLDIGCSTGYSTAIIAHLAKKVIAIEVDAMLASRAQKVLNQMDIEAIVVQDVLEDGYDKGAPYDVIIMEGAIQFIPDILKAQLAEDGRIIAIYDQKGVAQSVIISDKHGLYQAGCNLHAPLLPGFVAV